MGLAFGTATEDMDALTFGSKFLIRGFNSKREPVTQVDLGLVLEGFGMSMDEFIDLCIMCGCDYTVTITGIGPVRAFKLIEENRTIEASLDKLREINDDPKKVQKFTIPENFMFAEARGLFVEPDVIRDKDELQAKLKWNKPDSDALRSFLVEEKAFQEAKVASGLAKLQNSQGKVNQSRLDLFFKSAGSTTSSTPNVKAKAAAQSAKRKTQSLGGRGRGKR